MVDGVSRCGRCNSEVAMMWTFCPSCGASIERPQEPSAARSEPDELSIEALRLLSQNGAAEAEALLAAGVDAAGPEARLLYGRLLMDRSDFQAARLQFDEALRRAPGSFMGHVRRCEFFARVGLYNDALADAMAARRVAPDVAALLHAQDLERRLGELSRHSFVRAMPLPAAPSWLGALRARFRKTPAPAGL